MNSRRLKRNVGVLPSDHCLRFPTKRVTTLRLPSGKVIWDLFLEGFGPLKTVAAACDEIPIYGTVGLAAGLSRALTQEDDK